MKNKYIYIVILSIISFLMQITVAPFLSVNSIKPDFVAVAVVFIGLVLGPFHGLFIAFILGLLVDTLSGFSLGTSALVYVWGTYLIGFFRNYEFWLGFNFSVIAVLAILVMRSLLTFIYILGSRWNLGDLFIVSVIPETIYSAAFAGIYFVFAREKLHQLYLE